MAGTRQLQGVQGRYKAATRGTRQVRGSYIGCKVGMRKLLEMQDWYKPLQWVQSRYKATTRDAR